jgi:hypothetical protein
MTLPAIANLRHAARNQETVTIGGGQFRPAELRHLADLLEYACNVLAMSRQVEEGLENKK